MHPVPAATIAAAVLLAGLLLPAPADASGTFREAGFFDNAIAVYYTTDPTYPSVSTGNRPIPGTDGTCVVDTTIIDNIYSHFSTGYGPSFITVRVEDVQEDPNLIPAEEDRQEPFALADCMGTLVAKLDNDYPGVPVLLDMTALFFQHPLRKTLYANRATLAQTWWTRAQNSVSAAGESMLPASRILGIISNDEAYDATNGDLNNAVSQGISYFTSWSTVDRVVGFSLDAAVWDKTINGGSRGTNGFPWRYDVISTSQYLIFNPNDESDSRNQPASLPFYDKTDPKSLQTRYGLFLDRLQSNQRAALNVRAFWREVDQDNFGWSENDVKLTVRAWCRWKKGLGTTGVDAGPRDEVDWVSFWSYDQFQDPDDPSSIFHSETLYDPGAGHYAADLDTFHDTIFAQGWGASTACP